MAIIPLHCNICPKEPEFSDISHLLTHVASKGHLSHYFKAQVRARQDENIRHKIDIYDQWYAQYQIEKLLSQRMSSKELKDGTKSITRNNSKTVHPLGPGRPPRRRIKRATARDASPSPVKTEEIIDPRLSHSLLSPHSSIFLETPSHDAATRHRTHVPRMLDWQAGSPNARRRSSSVPNNYRSPPRAPRDSETVEDAESDCFRAFLQSPLRTTYPDPAHVSNYVSQRIRARSGSEGGKETACPSPVLKGVKWPGMSLFDSADQEAQRLRNQKKDGSVLEQMEIDSAAIEPMEHIYWPEGGLKKKRLITGNVESSPIKELTPPPRRPRIRSSKVLTSISANAPKVGKKRGRKPGKAPGPRIAGLENMTGRAATALETVYPRHDHISYDPLNDSEHDTLWTAGSPINRCKAAFAVFKDNFREGSQASTKSGSSEDRLPPTKFPRQDSARPNGLPASASYCTKTLPPLSSPNPFSSRVNSNTPPFPVSTSQSLKRSFLEDNRENGFSLFGPNDHLDVGVDRNEQERVTQRYFSVTGNQPPQFFNKMPPQMDFGGMTSPPFYGTSLNPLNPFLRQQYQQPHFSPNFFTQALGATAPQQLPDDSLPYPIKHNHTQKATEEKAP
ncbi:MAG: hypothetical protein Q9163_001112 [Psora crenata]